MRASIFLTTAPTGMPADSALPPAVSLLMRAPMPVYPESNETPNSGRVDLPVETTFPLLIVAVEVSSVATRNACAMGIAKPRPMLPD